MNVLIIEDEPQASQRLETLVKKLVPTVTVLGKIDTVTKAVEWIKNSATPDLIFMDIQLADGISFQIFEQCEVKSPVIFTTAYDEYALKAFKVNSIDYILKPVDQDELESALKKYDALYSSGKTNYSGTGQYRAGHSNAHQEVQDPVCNQSWRTSEVSRSYRYFVFPKSRKSNILLHEGWTEEYT